MKLSIVIPTLNEERTLETVIRRILQTPFPLDYELIIVDDHSTDRTLAIAQRLRQSVGTRRMVVVHNRVNKGKGACIRQGLKHAAGELVIVQDADLEYHPADIPALLPPVLTGQADAVYGSRFLTRRWPEGMAWPNYLANRLLTGLTNLLYGVRLTDMETCYKLMRREQLARMRLRAARFEFEPEVTAKFLQGGGRIVEMPIGYHGRSRREGKKIRAKDFLIALWVLFAARAARSMR